MKKQDQRHSRSPRPRALVLCVLHFLLVILSATFAVAGARPVADRAPALSELARVLATPDGARARPVEARDTQVERISRPKPADGDRSSRALAFVATLPAPSAVAPPSFAELARPSHGVLAFPALCGAAHRARGPPVAT